jgi:hypothetical protein
MGMSLPYYFKWRGKTYKVKFMKKKKQPIIYFNVNKMLRIRFENKK